MQLLQQTNLCNCSGLPQWGLISCSCDIWYGSGSPFPIRKLHHLEHVAPSVTATEKKGKMKVVHPLLSASAWKWHTSAPLLRVHWPELVQGPKPDGKDGKCRGPLGYLVGRDLLPHLTPKRIWEQWDHVYARFIRMAWRHYLAPLIPSFLFGKMGYVAEHLPLRFGQWLWQYTGPGWPIMTVLEEY